MAGTGSTKWKTFNASRTTGAKKRRTSTQYQSTNPNAPDYVPF